jgi:hypothetical protein
MKKAAAAAAFLLLVFIASYQFTNLWFELNWEFRGAPWADLVRGTAPTPFQYRALVPCLVRAVSGIRIGERPLVSAGALFFWIQCASTFLLVLATGWWLSCVFPRRGACVLALSILLVLPFNYLLDRFLALRYPSDFPSLLFFTLGLVLLRRRRWGWFYPLFVVATFNRETTLFLTVVYLLTAWGTEPRRSVGMHLRLQLILWIAAKAALFAAYRGNPGSELVQAHVRQNLEFLSNPRAWPLFFSNLGYLWLPVLLFRRRIPDRFLRRAALAVYPYAIGMFLVGNMYELRIYGELIPLVLPAFLLLVRELAEEEAPPPGEGRTA